MYETLFENGSTDVADFFLVVFLTVRTRLVGEKKLEIYLSVNGSKLMNFMVLVIFFPTISFNSTYLVEINYNISN